MEDDYTPTTLNSLSNLTYVPSTTNDNTIISDIDYYSNSLFDNESKKSNSFANAISEEEKEKKKQSNLNNKKSSQNSDSNKKISLSPIYIKCKFCNKFFLIKFYNYYYISVKCKCSVIKNISPQEFISDYCSNKDEKLFKKYTKYCMECKKNLDEESMKDKAEPYNENGKITAHETHHLINLFNIKKKIKIIKEKLNDIDKDSPKNKIIILNLINNYKDHPDYYAYKTIKNATKFLSKEIFKNPRMPLKCIKLKNIYSFEELKKNKNFSNSFLKIEIDGKETKEKYENLDLFQNLEFNELVKLEIKNVKTLKDIKALTTCSFPNLKKLFLSDEEIDDNCIDIIKSMQKNIPNIKFISLYNNKITSPEIFEAIKKFKTLEAFYIGCNEFYLNKFPNKNKKYIFPHKLIVLGIAYNFNKETNYFIRKFFSQN